MGRVDDEQDRLTQAALARAAEWRKLQESIQASRDAQRPRLEARHRTQRAQRDHETHRVVSLMILALATIPAVVGWVVGVTWVAVPFTVAGIGWAVRAVVTWVRDDCPVCQGQL